MNDADDVAAASAAYLEPKLHELVGLPPRERYERLRLCFRATLEALRRRVPSPSHN